MGVVRWPGWANGSSVHCDGLGDEQSNALGAGWPPWLPRWEAGQELAGAVLRRCPGLAENASELTALAAPAPCSGSGSDPEEAVQLGAWGAWGAAWCWRILGPALLRCLLLHTAVGNPQLHVAGLTVTVAPLPALATPCRELGGHGPLLL